MSHERAAKVAKVEVSSESAGKLPTGTPKELVPLLSPSSLGDPSQKAERLDSEQTTLKNLTMQDGPDQKFDSEKTTEFDRHIPMLIEIFCGTAGVSAHFKLAGGRSMGIDHCIKRRKLKAAAVQMDLKQPWVQELVLEEVRSGRVDSIHMAPPCGTSSAARNIPISKSLKRRGAPQPRPLRSPRHPDGLPTLKGLSLAKVQSANELYAFCCILAEECEKYNALFIVENPENSFMWSTSYFKRLMHRFIFSVVDTCEYGSEYKKGTGFLSNFLPKRLQTRCSGGHEHKKWSVQQNAKGEWQFSTSKAAEYPSLLAKSIALSFLDHLAEVKNIKLVDDLSDHSAKVSTYLQPRRTRGPLLLSEFKTKVQISSDNNDGIPKVIPQDAQPPWQGIPVGSKLLETQPVSDSNGVVVRFVSTFGVYYSEQEFLQKALELQHPFDTPLPLEESNLQSIAFIRECGPASTAQFRAQQLRYYVDRAASRERGETVAQSVARSLEAGPEEKEVASISRNVE